MLNIKHLRLLIGAGIVTIVILSSFSTMAMMTPLSEDNENILPLNSQTNLPYEGRLRVYVVEQESRWNMYDGTPYHYALMDMAVNEQLSLDYLETYEDTIPWSGDIAEDNIMVLAAVFNPEAFEEYSYPPSTNPYDAYYVDAAAGTHAGEIDYNQVNDDFSHTVFIEEGTATWCQYCPNMGHALESIYDSGDYPFYYVALVTDKEPDAQSRINQFNIYGYPTAYFDGGYRIVVGGESSESPYRSRIVSCGGRDVHELNLSLGVEWLGNGNIEIDISIINNEEMNAPETPDTPEGPTEGNVGIEYAYTASTTDSDGDRIYYLFDWDDGTDSGWIGPYASGDIATADHIWDEEGEYDVKVKAKDTGGGGHETDWSDTLTVTIEPPVFEITVTGELFGVIAEIMNNGIDTVPLVDWTISVTGGILGGINTSRFGMEENLDPQESFEAKTNESILGLGKIDIIVTAQTTEYATTGFVIGPIVIVLNRN